jgi:hypothetical protein
MRPLLPFAAACTFALALALQAQIAVAASSTAKVSAHQTMEQRFTSANTAHDGHLTLSEAKAGYPTVARHFDAIDKDKKGYVTQEDIRAYYKAQRTLHRQAGHSAHKKPSS